MDLTLVYHWFFTGCAFVYGLMIGSFLNVCIYRLPPKLFVFDDLFFKDEGDFKYYFNRLLIFLKLRKEEEDRLEPSLYAEGVVNLIITPETVTHLAIAHNFNLFRSVYPDPVNIVKPRSFCPNCRNMIKWWMNIPILSYIFLGGKCYYCKIPISPRYAVNELITGALLGLLYYYQGMTSLPLFFFLAVLVCICVVVFYIDLDHWLIMDEITLPFTALAILASPFIPYKFFMPYPSLVNLFLFDPAKPPGIVSWFNHIVQSSPPWFHPDSLLMSLSGAVLGYLSFWAIGVVGTALLKREAMGGGDVKFAMLMGAFLGPLKATGAFFLAVVVGTLILLPMLLIRRKTGKDQVPFGCFLALSTVITVFLGDMLIWYYFNWPSLMMGM